MARAREPAHRSGLAREAGAVAGPGPPVDARIAAGGPACRAHTRIRVGRDYYAAVLGNDYSIGPEAIDRRVDITADLDRVQARLLDRLVADHPRSWGNAGRVTDPEHVTSAARLRTAFPQPKPKTIDDGGILRNLADYDAWFGVTFDDQEHTA